MRRVEDLSSETVAYLLGYAGLVMIGFELVKSMIVEPIKFIYYRSTFGPGLPWTTYEQDVLSRHPNEFEACLLYLKDFMEAIDGADISTIQALRKHRNELAHNLASMLPDLRITDHADLFEGADRVLFKLSNYRLRMEIGADPELQGRDIDWQSAIGDEYLIFEHVRDAVQSLVREAHGA